MSVQLFGWCSCNTMVKVHRMVGSDYSNDKLDPLPSVIWSPEKRFARVSWLHSLCGGGPADWSQQWEAPHQWGFSGAAGPEERPALQLDHQTGPTVWPETWPTQHECRDRLVPAKRFGISNISCPDTKTKSKRIKCNCNFMHHLWRTPRNLTWHVTRQHGSVHSLNLIMTGSNSVCGTKQGVLAGCSRSQKVIESKCTNWH